MEMVRRRAELSRVVLLSLVACHLVEMCISKTCKFEKFYRANVGEEVKLECCEIIMSDTYLVWKYNDIEITGGDGEVINGYRNRNASTKPRLNNCSFLSIPNIQLNDSGIYTCTESEGTGDEHQNYLYVSDVNECTSNPCQHSATCTDHVNSFSCTCVTGYTGTLCETSINEWAPCLNDSSSVNSTFLYVGVSSTLILLIIEILINVRFWRTCFMHTRQQSSEDDDPCCFQRCTSGLCDVNRVCSPEITDIIELEKSMARLLPKTDDAEIQRRTSSLKSNNTVAVDGRSQVRGVCVHRNRIYICRDEQEDVELYENNENTPRLVGSLDICGYNRPCCMTICSAEECLYITYVARRRICKVKLSRSNRSTMWDASHEPDGISVTSNRTVIVALRDVHKLAEYHSSGDLVREINLQPNISNPRYAVAVDGDGFLVCYGEYGKSPCGLTLIDSHGSALKHVTGVTMKHPTHVAVDNQQSVFVADVEGNCVLQLDRNLKYMSHVTTESTSMHPYRLCLDETFKELYVSDDNVMVQVVSVNQ